MPEHAACRWGAARGATACMVVCCRVKRPSIQQPTRGLAQRLSCGTHWASSGRPICAARFPISVCSASLAWRWPASSTELRDRVALRPQYRPHRDHHRALVQRLGGPLGEQEPGAQPVLFAGAGDWLVRLSTA
jgi:hypothetical protein